ncbi:hypothetical protein L6V77_02185 [Myxococcota bacterium]|jgi:hypothetical protein|nr:hypothetical protein [Myxococcota bacterium]
MRSKFVVLLLSIVAVAPASAMAQAAGDDVVQDPNDPGVVYKKETVYDFEDDVVEGSFIRPEGEYLDARRAARHSSLIRIRESFVPEMLKSAEDI